MLAEEIREYCLNKKGVTEGLPFDEDTLVFKVGGKIFLILPLNSQPVSFAAKANPEWSLELREEFSQITGAYHMNKKHWNSIQCLGLKNSLILRLIDHSYELVFNGLNRKSKTEILG